jgi:hypothetical protein
LDSLPAFINGVEAQRGKTTVAADAATLIADATALGASLGCGGG